jgi:transposase
VHRASQRARVPISTVEQWLAVFRKTGLEGLRRETSIAVPVGYRLSKLSAQQKAELAALVKAQPHMSRTDLWRAVRVRYGVDYSMHGLLRLATQELGYRGNGKGRSWPSKSDRENFAATALAPLAGK